MPDGNIDQLSINTLRFLAVDAVQKAGNGHPGTPMGASPMAYVLWDRFLKHNPTDPSWPDRDRFVLSAGHASILLYGLLHLTGYDLSLDEIKNLRQWGSKTPGHPEFGHTAGIETTTGPLGQGLGNAVGMALAERHLDIGAGGHRHARGHAVVIGPGDGQRQQHRDPRAGVKHIRPPGIPIRHGLYHSEGFPRRPSMPPRHRPGGRHRGLETHI